MRVSGKVKLLGTLLLAVVLGVGAAAAHNAWNHRKEGRSDISRMHVSYAFDATDDRELAGFADNIFTGRVVAQAGTHTRGGNPAPWTLYNVEVLENLKGTLPDRVLVNQEGGYSIEEGLTVLVEGDQLLRPGETYLFATKAGGRGRWHTLVPVYGDILIENSREHDRLKERFGMAVQQQIPFRRHR